MCNNPYAPNEEKIGEQIKNLVLEITSNYPFLPNQLIWQILHPTVQVLGDTLTPDQARVIMDWYDRVMAEINVVNAITGGYMRAMPRPDGKPHFEITEQGTRMARSLNMLLDYCAKLEGEAAPAEGIGHSPIPDAFRQEFDKTWNKPEGEEGKPDGG